MNFIRTKEEILQVIFDAREAKGMPQHEVAAHLGMTQQNYAKIERGTISMSTETMIRIFEFLEVSVIINAIPYDEQLLKNTEEALQRLQQIIKKLNGR